MIRISSFLLQGDDGGYWHFCPACHCMHPLPKGWKFDGNENCPTFEPSFKHTMPTKNSGDKICHYNLTAGKLHFCPDCTHDCAGLTIALPYIPQSILDGWLAPRREHA